MCCSTDPMDTQAGAIQGDPMAVADTWEMESVEYYSFFSSKSASTMSKENCRGPEYFTSFSASGNPEFSAKPLCLLKVNTTFWNYSSRTVGIILLFLSHQPMVDGHIHTHTHTDSYSFYPNGKNLTISIELHCI